MALDSNSTLKVGTGFFWTADVGTERPDPSELLAPPEPWENMGHTPIDDILNSSSEGGERSVEPSLQSPGGIRTSITPRTDTFNVSLLQFDQKSLKLYHGANSVVNEDGSIEIPTTPVPTEVAWMFIFRDGDRVGGLYTPRASIIRGDDFSISDTESMNRLTLAITPMEVDGSDKGSALTFIPPFDITQAPAA